MNFAGFDFDWLNLAELNKPDPTTIALLRDALKDAEAGEVFSVAIATQLRPLRTSTAYHIGSGGDVAHLFYALETLRSRLISGT